MLGRLVGQVIFYLGPPDTLITIYNMWQPVWLWTVVTWPMHIAQATACTMAFVVAIVTCLGREILKKVVRTESEWTFGDSYVYTSRHQNTSENEVFSLGDVKISSYGKTDWAMVELQQPVKYPTCAKMFEAVHITIVTQLWGTLKLQVMQSSQFKQSGLMFSCMLGLCTFVYTSCWQCVLVTTCTYCPFNNYHIWLCMSFQGTPFSFQLWKFKSKVYYKHLCWLVIVQI